MNRFHALREIAIPVAIVVCYAGLSAFSHYSAVALSRAV